MKVGKYQMKYCSVIFDPRSFAVKRTEKTYDYEVVTVAEWRKKYASEEING